jgi:two-component sensor histidine kinase/putative methionine-R-sulfoxide reductase with GAF domain
MRRKQPRRSWPSRRRPNTDQGRLEQELAQLRQKLAEKEAVITAMQRIGRVLEERDPGPEVLYDLLEIIRDVTHTDTAQILLLDEAGSRLTLVADTDAPEKCGRVSIAVGQGITGWAVEHRRPVVIPSEPWNDPRYLEYPGLEERRWQSLLCVPLVAGGEMLGAVNVRTFQPYDYSGGEANVLQSIAEQIAQAIRYQSRVATLERRASRLEAVSEVGQVIAGSPYLEEILQLLVSFVAERLNYKVVTVRLLDEKRNELVLRATQSQNYAYRKKRSIRVGESFAGKAIEFRQTMVCEDILASEEYIGTDLAEAQGLRSMVCVPMFFRDKPIGVLTCYLDTVHRFTKGEIGILESLVRQAAVAIEHAKLQVRSTLMQELHHRVKNSLQQIVSLLRLELSEKTAESVEELIEESIQRIQAIASVHDLLSREDLDRIGVKAVAETLAHLCAQTFVGRNMDIRIAVTGEDFSMSPHHATQIALILNELLMNAVGHGFHDLKRGSIWVKIGVQEDKAYIRVSNDGHPLPEGFDDKTGGHLGLKIVRELSRAVGGGFTIGMEKGRVVATVAFPITRASEET